MSMDLLIFNGWFWTLIFTKHLFGWTKVWFGTLQVVSSMRILPYRNEISPRKCFFRIRFTPPKIKHGSHENDGFPKGISKLPGFDF